MIRHIGIVTTDVKESMEFYAIFGFKLQATKHENTSFIDRISRLKDSGLLTLRLVNDDGEMIELLDYGKDTQGRHSSLFEIGLAHLSFTISSFADYDECDLVLVTPPTIDPEGKAKVAFCVSPEGTFIELVEMI